MYWDLYSLYSHAEGVAAAMLLRGKAWKDFTDSVTDKKE